jgi:hypothetical protein
VKFNRVTPAAIVFALGLSVAPVFAGDNDPPPPEPAPPQLGDVVVSIPHAHAEVVAAKE